MPSDPYGASKLADIIAPAWRTENMPLPMEKARCAVHQNTKVKALFSPGPVYDSVDNRLGISPEPHSAWLSLRCSPNEQRVFARYISLARGRRFDVYANRSM
jgi:hypothetical protein